MGKSFVNFRFSSSCPLQPQGTPQGTKFTNLTHATFDVTNIQVYSEKIPCLQIMRDVHLRGQNHQMTATTQRPQLPMFVFHVANYRICVVLRPSVHHVGN